MPLLSYADGTAPSLTARGIKIFDFVLWAKPFTEGIEEHAEKVAAAAGLQVDFVTQEELSQGMAYHGGLAEAGHSSGAGMGVLRHRALSDGSGPAGGGGRLGPEGILRPARAFAAGSATDRLGN